MKVEQITDARRVLITVVFDAARAALTDLCAIAVDFLLVALAVSTGNALIYDKAAASDPNRIAWPDAISVS